MDNVEVSRRNHNYKKGNKENAQPAYGSKSLTRGEKTSVTPFQLTNPKKEDTKNGPLKAKEATMSTSGETLKKVKTVQKAGKGVAVTDVKLRKTHSQAFLTEQAVRFRKIVVEAPKPPAAVLSAKPAPGMYKGKIIQSKIGSIWKSTATTGGADHKPPATKTEGKRSANIQKSRSKSVADLPRYGAQKPVPTRSKSVVDRPAQVFKPAATIRPAAGFHSARPPARTAPATLASTNSRNTRVASNKRCGTQNTKPKIPVTDKKINKPSVTSALTQYRVTMETAEERRAKLAEWQASKGKTFKRPAMKTAEPSKIKVSKKREADLNPQPLVEPQPAAQCNPEPEPRQEAYRPDSATVVLCADTQTEVLTHSQTPVIMNTSLDLLENSDVDPQDSVDDIVVNLCDALEAMATPSRCEELPQVTDVCSSVPMEDSKPEIECKKEELQKEMSDQVKERAEESDDQKVEEVESDDDDDDEEECMTETTPQMDDASVIKYSVKTTPYLQSVKKTIADEASTSRSRRKSNIKDLKFLTPVRRSRRIERISSRLPAMLVDPDPCVSSLAELVKLDDDPNAYIYRKNNALLDDLPDQSGL